MKLQLCPLLVWLLIAGVSSADSPVETIPLDEIWAWQMPGTRPIDNLLNRDDSNSSDAKLVRDIRRVLADRPQIPRRAFAVCGAGLEALRNAHAVFAGTKPSSSFPVGSDISIVFFSYQAGTYVHLIEIERRDDVISVGYRFVPHRTTELTSHFALIPLSDLEVGQYSVKIIRASDDADAKYSSQNETLEKMIVCRPFNFSIDSTEVQK